MASAARRGGARRCRSQRGDLVQRRAGRRPRTRRSGCRRRTPRCRARRAAGSRARRRGRRRRSAELGSSTSTASGSWSVPRPVRWAKARVRPEPVVGVVAADFSRPAGTTSRSPGNCSESVCRRCSAQPAASDRAGSPAGRGAQPEAMNLLNASERGCCRCSTVAAAFSAVSVVGRRSRSSPDPRAGRARSSWVPSSHLEPPAGAEPHAGAPIGNWPVMTSPNPDAAEADALTFVGNATTLLRLGAFTVLTDPNFLRRGQRAYLGKGLWSRRLKDPALTVERAAAVRRRGAVAPARRPLRPGGAQGPGPRRRRCSPRRPPPGG